MKDFSIVITHSDKSAGSWQRIPYTQWNRKIVARKWKEKEN
jgi:hypothetical protein